MGFVEKMARQSLYIKNTYLTGDYACPRETFCLKEFKYHATAREKKAQK